MAQVFDLRFATNLDCNSTTYCATVQITAQDVAFNIGTSSVFFNYNENALQYSSFNSLNFDGSDMCIAGIASSWDDMNADTVNPGLINFTMTLNVDGMGCPTITSNEWTDIAEVCFDVLEQSMPSGLVFSQDNTNFNSQDPNDGTNAIGKGSFMDMNESLDCGGGSNCENLPAIVINEINYNSPTGADSGDWVELYNASGSMVDLTGYNFNDSGASFAIPSGTTLMAGAYLVLVENGTDFTTVHATVSNFIGDLGFGFSGSGEMISLTDADGCVIDEVTYSDSAPWPTEPDGNGPTLALDDPALDNALPENWGASGASGGTPGEDNTSVTFTPPIANFTFNPNGGDAPITISFDASSSSDSDGTIVGYAWDFGTGDSDNGQTVNYEFTTAGTYNVMLTVVDNDGLDNTTVQQITITEPAPVCEGGAISTTDDTTICIGGTETITISASGGMGSNFAYLVTDETGTTILDGPTVNNVFDFNAAPVGVCQIWGIWYEDDLSIPDDQVANISGCFALSNAINVTRQDCTPDCTTTGAVVVITEINYNSASTMDSGDWVEIFNPNEFEVDLSGYSIADSGDSFVFTAGTMIGPNAYLVLSNNVLNFVAIYPEVSNFVGEATFGFGNAGEIITVFDANGCEIDVVEYDDEAPWPVEADGMGSTLMLNDPNLDNIDPANWSASANMGGSPGAAFFDTCDEPATPTIMVDANPICDPGTGTPVNATFSTNDVPPAGFNYQWQLGGVNIAAGSGGNNATITTSTLGTYSLIFTDGADCESASSNAIALTSEDCTPICDAPDAPTITVDANPICLPGTGSPVNGTFSTSDTPPAGYNYQWQLDGINISAGSGGNDATITTSSTGIFTLIFTDGAGCETDASNAIDFTAVDCTPICVPPATPFIIVDANPICIPGSGTPANATFSATNVPPVGFMYQWQLNGLNITAGTGGNDATLTTSTMGTYTLVFTDGAGCETPASNEISLVSIDCTPICFAPDAPIITIDANPICQVGTGNPTSATLSSPDLPSTGFNYQWQLNGLNITAETGGNNPTITTSTIGAYTLIFTDGAGCESEASNIIDLTNEDCTPGCTALSGTISTNDATTVCVGGDETITVNANGGTGENFAYIVTDGSGATILAGPTTDNTFSFSDVPAGVCQIWGVWYDGDLNIPDDQVANISGCYAMSNEISVVRQECEPTCDAEGGTISTNDATTVCVGGDETITVSASGGLGENFAYIVTDGSGATILAGPTTDNIFSFSDAPAGICQIWGIWYDGALATPDDQVANIIGCFEFSNPINVTRQECEPTCDAESGTISTDDATTVCVGGDETITVSANGGSGESFAYFITDGTGSNILFGPLTGNDFGFGSAPAGICQIWGVWYNGDLNVPDDQIGNITGCFEFSNPINVTRQDCSPNCDNPGLFNEVTGLYCELDVFDLNNKAQVPVGVTPTWYYSETGGAVVADPANAQVITDNDCAFDAQQFIGVYQYQENECTVIDSFIIDVQVYPEIEATIIAVSDDCGFAIDYNCDNYVAFWMDSEGNGGNGDSYTAPEGVAGSVSFFLENTEASVSLACQVKEFETNFDCPVPCLTDAGALAAVSTNVCLDESLLAAHTSAPSIPDGYEVLYVLTSGAGLVVEQTSDNAQFTVSEEGVYTIHTLVYNPATLDLSGVTPGLTTGFDINNLLQQGGGDICASLDVVGASFQVTDCVVICPEFTNATATPGGVCSGGSVELQFELQNGDGGTLVWYDNEGNVIADPSNVVLTSDNCDGDIVTFTAIYTPSNSECGEITIQPNTVIVLPSPSDATIVNDGCEVSLENYCPSYEVTWQDGDGNSGSGDTYTAAPGTNGTVSFTVGLQGSLNFGGCDDATFNAQYNCEDNTPCPTLTNATANPGGICSGGSIELQYELQNGDGGTLVWYDDQGNVIADPSNVVLTTDNCDGDIRTFTAIYTPANGQCGEVSIQPNTVIVLASPADANIVNDGCEVSLENYCPTFEVNWQDGDGNSGSGDTYTAVPGTNGLVSFTVGLQGSLSFGGCDDVVFDAQYNCENNAPCPTFEKAHATPGGICSGGIVELNYQMNDPDGGTAIWYDQNGNVINDPTNVVVTTNNCNGEEFAFTVIYTPSASTCGEVALTTNSVYVLPSPSDVTVASTNCTVSLNNVCENFEISWIDSDGNTGNGSTYTAADNTLGTVDFTVGLVGSLSFDECQDVVLSGNYACNLEQQEPDCENSTECPSMTVCTAPQTPIVICPDFCLLQGDDITIDSAHSTYDCSIVINGPCFTYTPLPGMEAFSPDFVNIVAYDLFGNCVTMEIIVEIGTCNEPPIAVDDSASGNANESLNINVLNNDIDPDGDDLTVCGFTQPLNGTVTENNGVFTYTPTEDWFGNDLFTYTICDEDGEQSTATVYVTIAEPVDPVDPCDNPSTCGPFFQCVMPGTFVDLCFEECIDGDVTVVDTYSTYGCSVQNIGGPCVRYTPLPGMDEIGFDQLEILATNGEECVIIVVDIEISDCGTNNPPIAIDDYATSEDGGPVTISVLPNDSDPDGDEIYVCGEFSQPDNGVVVQQGNEFIYTPNPGFSGTDSFIYQICDGNGGSDYATVYITVEAQDCENPPLEACVDFMQPLIICPEFCALVDEPSYNLVNLQSVYGCSVSIIDGCVRYVSTPGFSGTDLVQVIACTPGGAICDTVEVYVTVGVCDNSNLPPVANTDIISAISNSTNNIAVLSNDSDADGDALEVCGFYPPTNGTIELLADGSFNYIPYAGFTGSDGFNYTICDGNGGSASATVIIIVSEGEPTGENNAPIAANDEVTTEFGEPIIISVMANDSDPNGDVLSICGLEAPANGTIQVNGTQIIYEPNAGFFGTDSFEYSVCDGNGGEDSAIVTITVEEEPQEPFNNLPIANSDNAEITEGEIANIAVLLNDSDPDGDVITICSIEKPDDADVVEVDGILIVTPNEGFVGMLTFTYTICDGNGGSDSATVTVIVNEEIIIPVNNDPDAVNDVANSDGNPVSIFPLDNDSDPDGDALELCQIGTPTDGFIQVFGTEIVYTPNNGFEGTDAFNYIICDGNGGTATGIITIIVSGGNNPPVAQNDEASTDQDVAVSINVLENDIDFEGDILIICSFDEATNGTLTQLATGFVYEPNAGFFGTESFTYTICDGNGGEATATVTVTVNEVVNENNPPQANDDSASTTEGQSVIIDVLANDFEPDADDLSICETTNPANGTIEISGNTILYVPADDFVGEDSFSYTICDGNGGEDIGFVSVAVAPDVDPGCEIPIQELCTGNMQGIDICVEYCNELAVVTTLTTSFECSLTILNENCFRYTPLPAFTNLNDTINVEGCFGDDCEIVQVAIYVGDDCELEGNQNPIIGDDDIEIDQGQIITFNPLTNDSDPDGDIIEICDFSQPEFGVVDFIEGEFIYVPDGQFSGEDEFSYTVCDNNGGASIGLVSILVNSLLSSCNLPAIDTCAALFGLDSQPIDICVEFCNSSAEIVDLQSTYHCSVQTLDNPLCFRYSPLPAFEGQDYVQVQGCDSDGNCEFTIVYVNVSNDCTGEGKGSDGANSAIDKCGINVPNAISPNGDGINDALAIENLNCFDDYTTDIQIFDVRGQLIFEQKSHNSRTVLWNATNNNGFVVNSGTYYYVLTIEDSENVETKSGFIEIRR